MAKRLLKAQGQILRFKGFMALYVESSDENGKQEESNKEGAIIPDVAKGDILKALSVDPKQNFTQPPPRYTEATLVKALEDNGVGRPSTYAAIISTIQEKEYDIVLRLAELMNPELTPEEEKLALSRIRASLTSAWQTRLVPHQRPTVADELDNILFYLTDILYRVTPVYYEALEEAFEAHFGKIPDGFLSDIVLRFGSWVGGDMDGNPNVNAKTIRSTLARQRALHKHDLPVMPSDARAFY